MELCLILRGHLFTPHYRSVCATPERRRPIVDPDSSGNGMPPHFSSLDSASEADRRTRAAASADIPS